MGQYNVDLGYTKRVTKNQFRSKPGISTTKSTFLLKRLMEIYRENKKDLHILFIKLEKVYNIISRTVLLWVLENKGIILDIYKRQKSKIN